MLIRTMPSKILLIAVVALGAEIDCFAAAEGTAAAQKGDRDSDGDGLSDFQEMHKYRTDPAKKDSSGAGTSDGDWAGRREFTYSVRAVIRVMPPYNLPALTDDYQDVRVIAETKDYAELEVVIYPLNTCAGAITGNANWREEYAGMGEFLSPGVTTNWDASMREQLLAELHSSGIDPEKLTDKEVVQRVSRWMYSRARHRNMFCTYYVHFPDGKAAIFPGLEQAFEREKGSPDWSVPEQFSSELFGKEMFQRKVYGTCTSAAVAQATVLRALGIPTRLIIAIPLADASDEGQLALVRGGLTHHQVRKTVMAGLSAGGNSFAAHTFLEVFVGNRWRRLNYNALGQNVLDPGYLGLMVHVHTFNDLSEAGLAATWGARFGLRKRDGEFKHSNPYKAVAVSDHFGRYAKVPNPPAQEKEHKQITIDRAYWADAKDAPDQVREVQGRAQQGNGRFWIHGVEWFDDVNYVQYKQFMQQADKNFTLSADGHPEIHCRLSMSYVTNSSANVRDMEIVIDPEDLAKMAKNVPYSLRAMNGVKDYRWRVKAGLTLRLELSRVTPLDAILERLDRLEKRVETEEKEVRFGDFLPTLSASRWS